MVNSLGTLDKSSPISSGLDAKTRHESTLGIRRLLCYDMQRFGSKQECSHTGHVAHDDYVV